MRDQIYISLDLLGGLPPVVANSVAEQIVSGIALIVQTHREVITYAYAVNVSLNLLNYFLARKRNGISFLRSCARQWVIRRLHAHPSNLCMTLFARVLE